MSVVVVDIIDAAAVIGSTVEFTCTARNSEVIDYIINGTSADSSDIRNIGLFLQCSFDNNNITITRRLSVTVSSRFNNTEILCRAIKTNYTDSNTATLTVQGK